MAMTEREKNLPEIRTPCIFFEAQNLDVTGDGHVKLYVT